MQPTFKLLLSHPAHFISLGFGSGLAPKAPGTFGSFAAWGVYALLSWRVPAALRFEGMAVMLIVVSFLLGAWCIERTGAALGEVDHGAIVWDEFVAVWLVLVLIPTGFGWQLAGVLVFRFFDILKPWPIRQADRRFKNGLGVMFDDVLAALYTLACLWLALTLLA
ncbi:phosphatidylglycerophosphatase A family protein [Uliginosibacterium aquaticum]|uniref:Phosphatidylglycerophosphatase A n=1 Tax=Uliginosibacterium aquaticum TaxID=2731212 RepID=A0ABX2IH87_9RHOO|nr:phosphatidylglycerophosphatase A [Uliginosibacterium aquaticum]NSL56148.1 phosphatidylglycerophosphatase A [Uliginosibacterium aquaticum]